MKKIHILGGGTVFHLRPHLALSAPAYGKTAKFLVNEFDTRPSLMFGLESHLGLTKMAMGNSMERRNHQRTKMIGETNADVAAHLEKLIVDPDTKMIFMSTALCDFEGSVGTISGHQVEHSDHYGYKASFERTKSGKDQPRLKSSEHGLYVELKQADKLISQIRKTRKDIFLVGFKTTAGASEDDQYQAGLTLLKSNSCNLVLANDVQTGLNMIICPELATYSVTHDRVKCLLDLIDMSLVRSRSNFTRTEVSDTGHLIQWKSSDVLETLRKVVDWCVKNNAYKAFNNVTVGHFGVRKSTDENGKSVLLSSRRKQNFNNESNRDLVVVHFDGTSQVAYGAKPSAGARSQFMVLSKYDDLDCIVHFHCPIKPHSMLPVRSQREFECGSHQCGKNTVDGMIRVNKDLAAVMLDKHGPNVVFSSKADPAMVIDFIQSNFDLSKQSR